MNKNRNTLQQDRKTMQTNGLMEAFSISLAILSAVNIYKGKVIFSQGLDLIPCIAFAAIGISAYFKKRKVMISYKMPWYYIYATPCIWLIGVGVELITPIPLSVFILGIGYIFSNQLSQRYLSKL